MCGGGEQPTMSKKIKLGDSSTWATTEKMKEILAPKKAEPVAVIVGPVKKEGKTMYGTLRAHRGTRISG